MNDYVGANAMFNCPSFRSFGIAVLFTSVAWTAAPASANSVLIFKSNSYDPFNTSSGPSPVQTFDGVTRYDKPRERYTYGTIDSFQVRINGALFTPINATVYLDADPFFGIPLLDFEGDVPNFNGSGSSLHFLMVNEYQYGAAMNLGYTGGPLEWQSLSVFTLPRNPVPSALDGTAAAVPEPATAALMAAGAVVLFGGLARRRSRAGRLLSFQGIDCTSI